MDQPPAYRIHLDPMFDSLQRIDIPALIEKCRDEWFNQTLCQVNDSVVRLGVLHGEFHWHKHDAEDEFFLVLQGRLWIDLEGAAVSLGPHEGFTIPKGVIHRTRAPDRTAVLMVERSSIKPTGD